MCANASWFAAESGEILEADARMAANDDEEEESGCDEHKWARDLAKESGSASVLSLVRQNAYVQCFSDATNDAWKDATDSSSHGVGPGWSSLIEPSSDSDPTTLEFSEIVQSVDGKRVRRVDRGDSPYEERMREIIWS
jgi:hypothetical protein